jgi:transcriptional regulator with XRE-family HTH domain/quercetin dioxygenase-like cupin family protein
MNAVARPDHTRDPAEIGREIAALRRERGMKMVELSRAAGVSPSMISQIERGHALPSVSTLYAIAEALAVTVHDLFTSERGAGPAPRPAGPAEAMSSSAPPGSTVLEQLSRRGDALEWAGPDSDGPVVRRDERRFMDLAGGVRWERLTPFDLPDVDILATLYPAGAVSSEHLYRHPGREMHHVTEGRIVIELGFQRYELATGDSITFHSTEPHRYLNPFDEPARGFTVLMFDRPG